MPQKLLFLFSLLVAPVLAAEPLPLDHFIKDGDYLDVSLSPSGKRLAARARVDDRVVMAVIDRATGQVVGGARPHDDSEVYRVLWINDERLLFSYAEETPFLDARVATGELFGIDFDGSNQQMLAGFRAADARTGSRLGQKESSKSSFFLLNELEGNDKHVLIIEYPWTKEGNFWYDSRVKFPTVSRLNVKNGRQKKVETLPYRNAVPMTTKDGKLRFVTYENEDGLLQAVYRTSDKAEWQPITDAFKLEDESFVVGLNDAGTAAYLRGEYGDERYNTIFRLDLETQVAEPMFTDLDADIVDWLFDEETGELAAGVSMRGKPRYHYPELDTTMKRAHRKLAKAFAGKYMEIVSWTDDGTELMVRVSSDVDPGQYYIFNNETNKADFFWANLSWIDPRVMRPMLLDEVQTEDGMSVPVRLTLPDGDAAAPLVVYPHGGPHGAADVWGFDRDVQLLANRGYAVLQVNFRGSGYLGEEYEEAGYRQWGGTMIDDIAAATRWAIERPDVDGGKVCAYGASYGAYAAYMLAVREPELLTCTAGYVGVYDLNIMFSKGDIPKSWGGVAYLERVLGTDQAQYDAFSPVKHAGEIQAKTMLIHGDADQRAPIAHAKAMRAALTSAGNEAEWIELDHSGHGAGSMYNRRKLYEGLLGFLDSNLK